MVRKLLIVIICALLIFGILLCVSSCFTNEEQRYYADKSNYVNSTGVVTYMKYNETMDSLYLGFSELSYKFDDTCFKISGENVKIVQENQIENKIKVGTEVDFITAPRYFGDGYVMPIVALSVNGEILLNFEDGYENWIEWLDA